jgi:hypothetical protein
MPRDDPSRIGGIQMQLDKVFDVVRSVAKMCPAYASETDGSLFCFFCGNRIPGSPEDQMLARSHKLDCAWLLARHMARDS